MGDIIDFKKISQSEIGDFVLSPEDAFVMRALII